MEIEVRKGHFGYSRGRQLLKNISFRLPAARILTILGQNGIGKTTLLKCLLGILPWEKGTTLVDGKQMNYSKHMTRIGYVPQAYKFVFPYSVEETVMMGLAGKIGLFSTPAKKDKQRVDAILADLGLFHLKNRLCSQLSGGQLQLVFMARGLVKDPELMILDEPESHLDYKNQIRILRMLENLAKERGISCIINTHYPDHALRISDATLMLGAENTYVYGSSNEIITEENIQSFFGVESRIIHIEKPDKTIFKTVVVTE